MKKVAVSLSVGTQDLVPQVRKIQDVLKSCGVEPIVVLATHGTLDPHGTKMAESVAAKNPNVYVATAETGSFTNAYLNGIKTAVKVTGADFIISMDADGSHDPDELPKFVAGLEKNPVVLSSRNLKGAQNKYPHQRQLISKIGTIVGNWLAGTDLTDFTSGYEGLRKEAVERIFGAYPPEKWISTNYAYHLQNTVLRLCLLYGGFKVTEIPIHYGKHRVGKKLGPKYLIQALVGTTILVVLENHRIKAAFR